MLNVPLFKVFMSPESGPAVNEVLYSGYIGEGQKVVEFESILAKAFKNSNVVTTNSGTSALHLAYHMTKKLPVGGEVISTSMTCTASNTPIISNGLKIVWADVDPLTGNISASDIENKITNKTQAITVVHWGGNPVELDRIRAIGDKYNIPIIEDAAHAFGASYMSKPIGSHSDFVTFSFQAIKHITCIDGGALCTKSHLDMERAKLLRWFGIDRSNKEGKDLRCEIDVVEAGYKFHMNDVNAVVGINNIKHADEIVGKHRENAAFYNSYFSNVSEKILLSPENPKGQSSYWLYTLHLNNRDEVMELLNRNGVGASKVHSANHPHSMFREFRTELPNTVSFEKSHLCIPVGWWVSSAERERIAELVVKYAK